jgi:hypothetical protein
VTALDVLDRVLAAGGQVVGEGDRVQLLVPRALKPLALPHRDRLKLILGYRDVLRRAFRLIAEGPEADYKQVAAVLAEQARLLDELGPREAKAVARRVAREWWLATEHCPYCAALDELHLEEA